MPLKQQPSTDIVIFGGYGDLALNKIIPALYYLFAGNYIHPNSRIISIGRTPATAKEYRQLTCEKLKNNLEPDHCNLKKMSNFVHLIVYMSIDVTYSEQYTQLQQLLNTDTTKERIYYLSTSSSLFGDICNALQTNKLVTNKSRVVIEKPIGHNLHSFYEVDNAVSAVFAENAIFRIDHYLGKDTVQNILALRFSNVIFNPIWSSKYIDNIQITIAETLGVENRLGYYNKYGAMRDMVQNHLLQLLCLVAMEPPHSLSSNSLSNEKIKILHALRPITANEARNVVRGKYKQKDGDERIDTETFVALRIDIDNWNWRGVPFYLRTGKKMSTRLSQIVIEFKEIPHSIFKNSMLNQNKLVIHLQPDQSIKLALMNKVPSLTKGIDLQDVELELNAGGNNPRTPTAYERLLLDVINNDTTLFMRRDEVEAAWQWTDSVLKHRVVSDIDGYKPGEDGPKSATTLLTRDKRVWHNNDNE